RAGQVAGIAPENSPQRPAAIQRIGGKKVEEAEQDVGVLDVAQQRGHEQVGPEAIERGEVGIGKQRANPSDDRPDEEARDRTSQRNARLLAWASRIAFEIAGAPEEVESHLARRDAMVARGERMSYLVQRQRTNVDQDPDERERQMSSRVEIGNRLREP